MTTFIYTDNKKKQELLQLTVETIAQADKLFNAIFGVKVDKCPHIGCQCLPSAF